MAQEYYESDITRMIRELLAEKPHIAEEQKKGRALWWDRNIRRDELNRAEQSKIRQAAYVYQTKV